MFGQNSTCRDRARVRACAVAARREAYRPRPRPAGRTGRGGPSGDRVRRAARRRWRARTLRRPRSAPSPPSAPSGPEVDRGVGRAVQHEDIGVLGVAHRAQAREPARDRSAGRGGTVGDGGRGPGAASHRTAAEGAVVIAGGGRALGGRGPAGGGAPLRGSRWSRPRLRRSRRAGQGERRRARLERAHQPAGPACPVRRHVPGGPGLRHPPVVHLAGLGGVDGDVAVRVPGPGRAGR